MTFSTYSVAKQHVDKIFICQNSILKEKKHMNLYKPPLSNELKNFAEIDNCEKIYLVQNAIEPPTQLLDPQKI